MAANNFSRVSVFLSVGAGFKIYCLRVGLAFVCPSKLNVLFSRRICEFCRTGVISHLRFRTRFSFLTVFQILYSVVAEEIQ